MPPQAGPEDLPTKMVSPSTRMAPPGDPHVGTNLGKYRITRLLGKGGMGAVYAAEDSVLGREVAIKVLLDDRSGEPEALERFLLEARAAAKLNHPNVVAVHDVAESSGMYYIVMEFIDGVSAQQMLRRNGHIDWKEACRITADCCRALRAAHKAGFIHRDIKPANIMISREAEVKLADFGLAKATERTGASLTTTGAILCSPEFMSPEQCTAKPLDARTDVYSLGATLYAMLCGSAPFARQGSTTPQLMYAHCYEPTPDPRKVRPEVPQAVVDVILKATSKKPEDRYQSAAEMLSAMEAVAAGTAPGSRGRRRGGKLKWIAALLILGAGAGAAWHFREEIDWEKVRFWERFQNGNGAAGDTDKDSHPKDAENKDALAKDGVPKDGVAPKDGGEKDGSGSGSMTKDGGIPAKDGSAPPKDGTPIVKDTTKKGTTDVPDFPDISKDGPAKDGTKKDGGTTKVSIPPDKKDDGPTKTVDVKKTEIVTRPEKDNGPSKDADKKDNGPAVVKTDVRRQEFDRLMKSGREQAAAKSFDQAIVDFRKAEKLFPGDAAAFTALEKAIKDRDDHNAANAAAAERRSLYAGHVKAGKDAFAGKRYGDAVREFGLALKVMPNDTDAVGWLAQATKARDEETASLEGRNKRRGDYDRMLEAGRRALSNRKYDEAAREFAAAGRRLLPGDPQREQLIGESERLHKQSLALLDFSAHLDAGRAATTAGRDGDAVKSFTAALKVFPKDEDALRLLDEAKTRLAGSSREVANGIGMRLMAIPAGEFLMGSNDREEEKPVHKVRITRDFLMGAHPVTVAEFRRFVNETGHKTDAETDRVKGGWLYDLQQGRDMLVPTGTWKAPGFTQADDHPVVLVSWHDADEFCKWLTKREGKAYRLPTEAEWEYACRARSTTRFSTGDDPAGLEGFANVADSRLARRLPEGSKHRARCAKFDDNYDFTSPVGRFKPNAFGLYDMHGNVLQWCHDRWNEPDFIAYRDCPLDDPIGAPIPGIIPAAQLKNFRRILRGGNWKDPPEAAGSATRNWYSAGSRYDHFGFRVVRER